jgi:hypothetical protein
MPPGIAGNDPEKMRSWRIRFLPHSSEVFHNWRSSRSSLSSKGVPRKVQGLQWHKGSKTSKISRSCMLSFQKATPASISVMKSASFVPNALLYLPFINRGTIVICVQFELLQLARLPHLLPPVVELTESSPPADLRQTIPQGSEFADLLGPHSTTTAPKRPNW